MMYAIIETGGKQYRVAPDEEIKVEKLEGEVGDSVVFDQVLMTSDGEKVSVGKPYLEGTRVAGRIMRQGKNRKVIVYKFKRRTNYQRKRGHRQAFTLVRVEGIEAHG
jgi:large subunit ribosomal protein L21